MKNIIFAAAALLAVACTPPASEAPTPPPETPMPVDVAPFIARAGAPATEHMEALARGQLTIVDGCVRLTEPTGNPGYLVVWPFETSVDASTGAVRIRNSATGSEAGVGDRVEISGGEVASVDAAALAEPVPAECAGPYWIAGPQLTVVTAP